MQFKHSTIGQTRVHPDDHKAKQTHSNDIQAVKQHSIRMQVSTVIVKLTLQRKL